MIVGVIKESCPGETRVALTPDAVARLTKYGMEIHVQSGAGVAAGYDDQLYSDKGAKIIGDRAGAFERADVICQVRTIGANPDVGRADLPLMRSDSSIIGLADPLAGGDVIQALADTGVRCFALELLPRITRAQAMDVLSSQATVAGYKAVLLAASHLPRMAPMMMTAAGTIPAAKVFVIGAGVAGLQAIASARRLGAVVFGYDIRPVVKEQVESLGAKFVQIELSSAHAESQSGYAKAMDEAFYRKQRELLAATVSHCDIVITTAAVPGAAAPVLITTDMIRNMQPGSVIVDLAARPGHSGGNCELTQPDQTIVADGVTILGPTNLPATVPQTASTLYARNMTTFLQHIIKDGALQLKMDDEITAQTLLTQNGAIVNERVRSRFTVPISN